MNWLWRSSFILCLFDFRRSARSGGQAASEATWPLHAVLVRDQSGVRNPANADHASGIRCVVPLLCGRDPLSSYYCSHDSPACSNYHQIARWNLDRLPTDWLSTRRRWDLYHRVRVLLLIVVQVLLILSALLDP